jgi:hypothetical protein
VPSDLTSAGEGKTMNDLLQLRRAGWGVLLAALWLAVSAPAWAAPNEAHRWRHTLAFQPVLHPLAWHREHWRQRRRHDPSFVIELPKSLFDAYTPWGYAPQPGVPPRPDPITPRERRNIWRDDVVGSGSGGRIETHPEGRILRSRPRGD